MKYVLVTGGVISGVGKGIIASSIGVILKSAGFRVSAIKIDPYINIDAGTFSPYEHGEVFVLDDGGEVDLDLGNYERFLDVRLNRDNNITTGKIYKEVIDNERKGVYLGKTVQVVPHITDKIQEWVERVAHISVDGSNTTPDVCVIELGGTIGDIESMPFVEAFRQFERKKGRNFMTMHVTLVPEPKSTGEHKTKPTQSSIRELRGLGLSPDLMVCRSETLIGHTVKQKISNFCHVPPEQVICVHDVTNIYHVPLILFEQNLCSFLIDRLDLCTNPNIKRMQLVLDAQGRMQQWRNIATHMDSICEPVSIALVGKYIELEDAYTSVVKALKHASVPAGRRVSVIFIRSEDLEESKKNSQETASRYHEAWSKLTKADGILVPGGFGHRGIEGKIAACQWARIHKKPFLGVCLGMQCAVIEIARNMCGIKGAHSTEFNPDLLSNEQVVIDMPEHSAADKGMGASMRLGKRATVFLTQDSKLRKLYPGNPCIVEERHRHRYEVNPTFIGQLEEKGLKFVGMGLDKDAHVSSKGETDICLNEVTENLKLIQLNGAVPRNAAIRMEIVELQDHPYFVGVQYHPEYLSHPLSPSPAFKGLVLAAAGTLIKSSSFVPLNKLAQDNNFCAPNNKFNNTRKHVDEDHDEDLDTQSTKSL